MLEAYTLQADYLLAQLSDLNEDLDDFQARRHTLLLTCRASGSSSASAGYRSTVA